jgi:hypothetical protein
LKELRNGEEFRVEWAIVQAQARQDFAHRLKQVSLS